MPEIEQELFSRESEQDGKRNRMGKKNIWLLKKPKTTTLNSSSHSLTHQEDILVFFLHESLISRTVLMQR